MQANQYAFMLLFYALAGVAIGIGNAALELQAEGKTLPLKSFEFLGALLGFGYAIAGVWLMVGLNLFAGCILLVASAFGSYAGRVMYESKERSMVALSAAAIPMLPVLYHFCLR